MKRFLSLAAAATVVCFATGASAQVLVHAENWESAMPAASWYCSTASNQYFQSVCGSDVLTPLAIRDSSADMTPSCAGKYVREELQRSGGRVFQRTPIAIANPVTGSTYCVTAWLRRGASNRYPFLGINYTNATGTPNAVTPGSSTQSETWLMGDPAFGGGIAQLTAAPGQWQWLSRQFTTTPLATHFIVKFETYCGNSGCTAPAGDGDFDDIRVYSGTCPAMPQGTESEHTTCATTKPICTSRMDTVLMQPTTVFSCASCRSGFGGATAPSCPTTAPICVTSGPSSGACQTTCDADNGVTTGTAPCPTAASPVCKAGACGTCTTSADCAAGTNHGGAVCLGGRCTTPCTLANEGTACMAGQYCNAPNAMGAGVCVPKVPNGEPVPNEAPLSGMCTPVIGQRVCVSAACETSDNRCGLLPGATCTMDNACRSGDCFTDGKCARPNGETCTRNEDCRTGFCGADGLCGKPNLEQCTMTSECRSGLCDTNGLCGRADGSSCTTGADCQSSQCADGKCAAAVPASSSSGVPSPSGVSIEGGGFACALEPADTRGLGFFVVIGATTAALAFGTRRRRR